MTKALKITLFALAGLALLAVAAAVVFVLSFDANRYKPEIERLVAEKTGRTLKLRGPLAAAIWPSLGAKVAGVSLSERGSEQPFVSLESAHASLALLPLFHGQVVVDKIRISGLKAEIVKHKDGRFNFSDLMEQPARTPAKETKGESKPRGAPVAFNVAGIDIDKSAVDYRDLGAGKNYSLSDIGISTGRLGERADGKLQVHAVAKGPELDLVLDLGADYRLDLPRQQVALDRLSLKLKSKVEETNVQGKVALAKAVTFDLGVDKLNLDAYFPPEKKPAASAAAGKPAAGKPAADTPVDLSALKDLNADGRLQIGALQVSGIKLADVKTEVRASGGRLDAPHSAKLYQGALSGELVAHADGRVALKDALSGVAIGPLLRDAAQMDRLEGKGNVAFDVNAAGKSVNAMKHSLGGTAKLELRDGAIKGIDFAALLSKGRAVDKSPFTEMSANFLIKNGVAHNDDLAVKSPLFHLSGRGDVDIGNSTLDYVTTASLSGHTVPVRLSGPFDSVKYEVDYGAAASEFAKSKAGEKLKERAQDRLRDLLRR